MLTINNVSRTFSDGAAGFMNVRFSAGTGEIIGILGTSGCGKSTLLRVLSGLDPAFEGEMTLLGKPHRTVSPEIGMIFQEPRLMPWLTVFDNVAFGLKATPDVKERVQQLLRIVQLEGFEGHYPKDLSGGMAQRVAIARALITKPNLLLLDEPFSALDAFTKMQLQDLLLDIWQERETTMVLVTHDIDEALYLCDRIFILQGQPGTLYEEIRVNQKRPRVRSSEELAKQKAYILATLRLQKESK
ncbi:ABC transporter ATP-binding protein [Bacillus fonticola]|uniref:ABC transporter ATP-binding protein n=1 Tax=Bacillus fonticola TaxID=2728853 RepID=UPI0014752FA1|nr:ABC transporter ATP-binding protein [Bacillus fonticola]